MNEIQLTEHEQWLLEQARLNDQANDSNVVELAKYLTLLPRVEPLLLRNVRLAFVPSAQTETESHLWFSPLVSIRSTQNFIFHRSIAMTLAQELRDEAPKQFDALWTFCQTLTRHWTPLEHLERDLRYALFAEDQNAITVCLQKMLRHIHAESDEDKRLDLARWAKRNLPAVIESPTAEIKETQWLAQYAAATLGDTAKWTELSQPEPLPDWLSEKLPPPLSKAHIGLQLRFDQDKQKQVLQCTDPLEEEVEVLPLNSPLPCRLFIECDENNENAGTWETVYIGSRIPLPTVCENLYLTTLEGQRYRLKTKIKREDINPLGPDVDESPLYLTYVEADAKQAHELQRWLSKNGIAIKLLLEQPGKTLAVDLDNKAKLIRLWTSAAQGLWADVKVNQPHSSSQSLMLRTEDIPLPEGVNASSQSLDMIDWQRNSDSKVSLRYATQINDWISHQSVESNNDSNTESNTEIQTLLQELGNPKTNPPRRLEIGDLLAKIGDPRPGVGVAQFEVVEYPPEIQDFLDALNDISTQPPRRLVVGNTLAEIGDPRPGVGLNEDGLPDIDWVQIPAGEFIYGEKETKQHLQLDHFYISRYSITNMQYQAFIDDGGYENEHWWQDLEKPETGKSEWSHSNRPKTDVNWYEAVAFCRWLSEQFDYKIQLSSEQQWEKAARGTDEREYPWGKKYLSGYANVDEQVTKDGDWSLKETTAVGVYPQGNSPLGIADMAGNVWEWCLNKHERPEVVTADMSKDGRVLRGGSWVLPPVRSRASCRYEGSPGNRYSGIGFRVCCVLPSTDH